MSRLWLAGLVVGMAGSACAQEASAPLDPLDLFDRACVRSGGDPAAFKAVGEKLGWEALPLLARPDAPDWGAGYGSPAGRLMMMGRDRPLRIEGGGDGAAALVFPAQVSCGMEATSAAESEQRRAEEFAEASCFVREPDGDLRTLQEDAIPGEEISYWNASDDRSLSIRHVPPDGRLVVEISYPKPAD
jgi:hypothetical protein